MATIELPHTAGCLVCGRSNPHGLSISLHVDTETGIVHADFTPQPHHIGFQGIIHGGVIATVMDEAMVWAATWSGKRFCVCAEMTVRYRNSAAVNVPLRIEAMVETSRSRIIVGSGEVTEITGQRRQIAVGSGKYMPLPEERNLAFMQTLVDDPGTRAAAKILGGLSRAGATQ